MKRVMPWWLVIVLVLHGSTSARAQTTLNLSQDLVTLGIAATNMVPNQPSLDAGPLFVAGVNYAKAHGISTVVADPGAYYFLSEAQPFVTVSLNQVSNLTIDFQGADLYFAAVNYGLVFSACSNLIVENFTIDRLQPGYTQLRVTSVDPSLRQIKFTVQPGWQNPTALNALLNNPAVVFANPAQTDVFVFRNGGLWDNFTPMPVQQPFNDDHLVIGPSNFVTSAILASIRPGDLAVLRVRVGVNAIMADCTSCTFRNIRIYSGMEGIDLTGPSSSSVVERVYVMPKPGTDRLVSTLADGITVTQPGPNNTVRLSRSIRTLDDGISPHTWVWGSVQSVPSARTAIITAAGITALGQGRPLPVASNVAFQRASDGVILGSAVVTGESSITTVGGVNQVTVMFDRDLPANVTGAYIYATDPSWRGDGLRLERNTVQEQGFARGISLWGLVNTTVSGNYLRRTAMSAVHLSHSFGSVDWLTPPLVGITLVNNVIDGAPTEFDGQANLELAAIEVNAFAPNFSMMPTSPNQTLTFTGNFIANAARSAFYIGNTTGASVTNNYLLHPNSNPRQDRATNQNAADFLKPIAIENSVNVSTAVNPVDTTSGQAFVTDLAYRELAAYAPGGSIRLNAYNLGALAAPTLTLTDADGVNRPMTIQSTSSHALDVQIPVGSALGGAHVTLTSGGTQYFGTLFVDSQDNIPAVNGCTYEASWSSSSVAATASTLPMLVVTQAGCSYPVLAPDAWATTSPGGTGPGLITVAFAANAGGTRTTTIEVAGRPFTITQAAAAPSITTQPTSQTVGPSQPFSLSVVATGPAPLSYQWYAGASGDTSHPLPTSGSTYSATASATCCFWVRVSNAGGHADSATAAITVGPGATTTPVPGVGTNFGGSRGGDAFLYKPSSGAWSTQLSSVGNFIGITSGAWAANWTVEAGDFNGDGLTDLFLYNSSTGQWFKAFNQGGGSFSYFGGTWAPGWTVTLLDFDGDGKTDVFLYNQTSGHWFRAMSVGDGDFSYVAGAWAPGWSVYPADFNGDGRADLFLYNHKATSDANHGLWFRVITQADGSFTYLPGDIRWANTWSVTPADLDGDGLTDLFLYNATNGQYFRVVFVNGVATYGGGAWGANWTISKGDFNGDGRADLFLYNKSTGLWFVVISSPDGTLGYLGGQWAANWDVTVTDLDADGRSDILLYNAATGQWFQALTVSPGTFSFTTGNWGTGWTVIGRGTILP